MTSTTLRETSQATMKADWCSDRGWFDELSSNSHFGVDVSDWNAQQERDRSLTLDPSEVAGWNDKVGKLVEVQQVRGDLVLYTQRSSGLV